MTDSIVIVWDKPTGRVRGMITAHVGEKTVTQLYDEPQWIRWSPEAEAAPKLLAALENLAAQAEKTDEEFNWQAQQHQPQNAIWLRIRAGEARRHRGGKE